MTAFITFVTANAGILIALALAILSVLTAAFNKNDRVVGILAIIRSIIERLSALQPANSKKTLKIPGFKANDVEGS